MLRDRSAQGAGLPFFGELRDGVPVLGVILGDGGYQSGTFFQGDIGGTPPEWETREWQLRHDSLEVAVRAAQAVSAHYAREGNTASAQHYSDVARTLDSQLDSD